MSLPAPILTVVSDTSIRLTYPRPVTLVLDDVARWSITAPGGALLDIISIEQSGADELLLTTGEHQQDGSYTLNTPTGAVVDESDAPSRSTSYVGVGIAPTIISAVVHDATHVLLTFSEAMDVARALDKNNYSIDPALEVMSLQRVSSNGYMMTTATMAPGVQYNVVIVNVSDLAGNAI